MQAAKTDVKLMEQIQIRVLRYAQAKAEVISASVIVARAAPEASTCGSGTPNWRLREDAICKLSQSWLNNNWRHASFE